MHGEIYKNLLIGVPDPRGSNAMMHYTTMYINGKSLILRYYMKKEVTLFITFCMQEKHYQQSQNKGSEVYDFKRKIILFVRTILFM